jgi:hypothetical protein
MRESPASRVAQKLKSRFLGAPRFLAWLPDIDALRQRSLKIRIFGHHSSYAQVCVRLSIDVK